MSTSLFPYLVGLLEFAGGLVYLWNGKYNMAVAWIAYAISAFALGRIK